VAALPSRILPAWAAAQAPAPGSPSQAPPLGHRRCP